MTIEEKTTEKEITLTLTGRLETTSSPELEKKLIPIWDEGKLDIVLDFQALHYLSSAGLRVLLMCEKKCNENGRHLTVVGANDAIREIFDITGLSDMLTIA